VTKGQHDIYVVGLQAVSDSWLSCFTTTAFLSISKLRSKLTAS